MLKLSGKPAFVVIMQAVFLGQMAPALAFGLQIHHVGVLAVRA